MRSPALRAVCCSSVQRSQLESPAQGEEQSRADSDLHRPCLPTPGSDPQGSHDQKACSTFQLAAPAELWPAPALAASWKGFHSLSNMRQDEAVGGETKPQPLCALLSPGLGGTLGLCLPRRVPRVGTLLVLTVGLEHAAADGGWAAAGLPEEVVVGVVRGWAGWLNP